MLWTRQGEAFAPSLCPDSLSRSCVLHRDRSRPRLSRGPWPSPPSLRRRAWLAPRGNGLRQSSIRPPRARRPQKHPSPARRKRPLRQMRCRSVNADKQRDEQLPRLALNAGNYEDRRWIERCGRHENRLVVVLPRSIVLDPRKRVLRHAAERGKNQKGQPDRRADRRATDAVQHRDVDCRLPILLTFRALRLRSSSNPFGENEYVNRPPAATNVWRRGTLRAFKNSRRER